ncbi:hypothetical protein Tco_1060741, partial [Tanacetum coccineum]
AKPVEIGKFLLEDGKELTLSRKSSPGRNCIYPDQTRVGRLYCVLVKERLIAWRLANLRT